MRKETPFMPGSETSARRTVGGLDYNNAAGGTSSSPGPC
jgi:hypothetical protein